MEQCRTDPRVFRMVVDGKVELTMAVHRNYRLVRDLQRFPCRVGNETCKDFHVALVMKFPTNNLEG